MPDIPQSEITAKMFKSRAEVGARNRAKFSGPFRPSFAVLYHSMSCG